VATSLTALALVLVVLGGGLEWALRTHPGHVLVTVGMPLLGALTTVALTGFASARQTRLAGVALVGFAAGLGLALVLGTRLLAPDFFVPLGLETPAELLVDQHRAGFAIWAAGAVAGIAQLATTRRHVGH
jgi:putative copper resistance protein D